MPENVQITPDQMDPDRARALLATLGISSEISARETLPPFFHHIYFWDPRPPAELGRDGHPILGGIVPDMGLPRRMWAGGRLEFAHPLLVGVPAEKRTSVAKAEHKQGRSGPLAFVTLRHEIWQDDLCKVVELQDLVYREEEGQGRKPVPPEARTDEAYNEAFSADTTILFRYSALTFNGHRIHYDEAYSRDIEGYDGLVVHGPLLAQMLMLLAERRLKKLTTFKFRATSPVTHQEEVALCWHHDGTCWVRGSDGRQCLLAEAR